MASPTTVAAVKLQLGIAADDTRDDARLAEIVGAVNNVVGSMAVAQLVTVDGTWPPRAELGAAMLGARLFRRKNSPAGVESFGSLGAAYVMRTDPDIAMMLGLGTYQAPQLG